MILTNEKDDHGKKAGLVARQDSERKEKTRSDREEEEKIRCSTSVLGLIYTYE